MISALIPAAGRGVRLGVADPKALVHLGGRPMILWSIQAIARVELVSEVIVAAPGDSVGVFEALRGESASVLSGSNAVWRETIAGGATRADSVERLLNVATGSRVLVHDAARPCITTAWVASLIEELGGSPAGVPAIPVRETLKRGSNGVVQNTVSRDGMYAIQTPQLFEAETLRRAHVRARRPGTESLDATDDAALVEALGVRVRLLAGDPMNLKVTYPDDVSLAERILESRRGGCRA